MEAQNTEDAKSPTTESPKTEKPETPAEPTPVLNGDASKEEVADTPKPEAASTEEPKKEEPKIEEPKIQEPKAEEPKVEEPKVEEPKVEETKLESQVEKLTVSEPAESAPEEPNLVKSPAEETKEVRNEEVPPPLPSSNPPSSLTAFAESTKADILNTETIDLLQVSTVVNPVLESEIGEPLFEKDILNPKKENINIPLSDSIPVSSGYKSETEPILEKPDNVIGDVNIKSDSTSEPQLKSELTTEPQKSETIVDIKSSDKLKPLETKTLLVQSEVHEPSSETSLQETEKFEPKLTEPEQDSPPLVHEILSAVSSDHSDNSDPLIISDEPLPESNTIELDLEPLPRAENDQIADSKDLQSKTDLEITNLQTEVNSAELVAPVEVKSTPENLDLSARENFAEPTEPEVTPQTSLPSCFIQTPKSSAEIKLETVEHTPIPQLKPVELVIEDAKPQNIEQPLSEQSLNCSEESESIDLPPPQESEQPQTGFVDEPKSDLPPAPINDECPIDLPSPTDLPPPSASLVDAADSLQDISTESLPSLPEPVSENLAEPMSLPPVDSVPEPIATDCLPPESIPVTVDSIPTESVTPEGKSLTLTNDIVPAAAIPLSNESVPLAADSVPVESNPLPPTECPPVLTNGSVNGLSSPGEVSPTMNGSSILLGEAAPLKQIPQDLPSEIVKDEDEKPGPTAEIAVVEE